ncbi:MAG TPA: hypothetical protein VK775_02005, partial [Chthoniobacterales bacterium]|nr:hypothetical protein [Chthoniobacterales bacterium]
LLLIATAIVGKTHVFATLSKLAEERYLLQRRPSWLAGNIPELGIIGQYSVNGILSVSWTDPN